jgi:hypothetical protein
MATVRCRPAGELVPGSELSASSNLPALLVVEANNSLDRFHSADRLSNRARIALATDIRDLTGKPQTSGALNSHSPHARSHRPAHRPLLGQDLDRRLDI